MLFLMKTEIIKSILVYCFIFSATAAFAQCPQVAGPGQHIVQSGETLYRIAKAYQVSLGDLCRWNNVTVYDTLKMCQALSIQDPAMPIGTTVSNSGWIPATYSTQPSAPVTASVQATSVSITRQNDGKHIVQPGETIAAIANAYGYTESRFRQFNNLNSSDERSAGSELLSSDCTCPPMWAGNAESSRPVVSYTDPTVFNAQSVTNTTPVTYSSPTETTTTKVVPVQPEGGSTQIAGAFMSKNEQDMVAEINLLRSNPVAYIPYVQKYAKESMLKPSPGVVAELIAELKNTNPMSLLVPSECLYTAARNHAESERSKGDIDHRGKDGLMPWDRAKNACPNMADGNENIVGGPSSVRNSVIVLLIDEGIPNRGHRKTLLNKDWRYAACYGAGTVGEMPNCYVQMFGY